mgnify:CR=1 FL=1
MRNKKNKKIEKRIQIDNQTSEKYIDEQILVFLKFKKIDAEYEHSKILLSDEFLLVISVPVCLFRNLV